VVARIRRETEVDRTEAALAGYGATLPLARGIVAITITPAVAHSSVGQRLLVLLINELARMKGVVRLLVVDGVAGGPVLPGVPVEGLDLEAGLGTFVGSLNASMATADDPYEAAIAVGTTDAADVRVLIGDATASAAAGVVVGADAWRALLGRYSEHALWDADAPYGAALAAALAAAEVFKRLLRANGLDDPSRRLLMDFAFSAFDFGIDGKAVIGPDVHELVLRDLAVVGCGAGGSAALYVLAMQAGIAGEIALVEPGRHKLSNISRYLMTTAGDVHESRHKLSSAVDHLARFAPALVPTLYPLAWEMLDAPQWPFLLSTVDTVPARWNIQRRAAAGAEILDAAVNDLFYNVIRVTPGGWCLECKHRFDPDYDLKQRAARWGVDVDTVRTWTNANVAVTAEMIAVLAETQGKGADEYLELEGKAFRDVALLTECGETRLRTDVPSQAPVLPLATTAAGVILAAEIAKRFMAPEAHLCNWLGHFLDRAPERPRVVWRPASAGCPHHHPIDRAGVRRAE
jgi:molybdopterin/thiamine biosynthesis adenylyltransferase